MSSILDNTCRLCIRKFLMLVFFNPLVEVAWDSWEVIESWLVDSILVFASDNKRCAFLLSSFRMNVHASSWLHGRSHWLLLVFGHIWLVATFKNLEFKFDIGMLRNWLATDWSPGKCSSIDIV